MGTVHQTDFADLVSRGKVRDLYQVGDQMMIVATDRISAFDVVMNEPIPDKGILLSRLSAFWLNTLPACKPHHLSYVVSAERVPEAYAEHAADLAGRAMVVKRVAILPVECIVRGYIVGSGWKDYQATGKVSGLTLPPGLKKAQQLPQPIFTPSTKATVGHDEPLSFEQAIETVRAFLAEQAVSLDAAELMAQVRQRSIQIYEQAAALADRAGILLADTKFEFGLHNGELVLADEVLTPDSSRFWPKDRYRVGENPPSFDKQFLRDYLESVDWNKEPPPPTLPTEIVQQTRAGYLDAYRRLTGKELAL
jgi:phosphoribosylaminoimidazole-succinocarboxamide synthase